MDPGGLSPADVKARLDASRVGQAFVMVRDDRRRQLIFTLDPARQVAVGRSSDADVELGWDPKVSRVHALLECVGGAWTVSDDGLSSNGTFCNGERVRGRRRLADGDALQLGRTSLVFREPAPEPREHTLRTAADAPLKLSDTQRRVLIALCRPYLAATPFTLPATNQDIAGELHLGVDAVKAHLRVLFEKFEIEHLPQNQKRGRLAELAFHRGVISERDLT
jgi:pSer/pThr/pTyr-binding forkhead associated (FHA) protein